MSTILDRWKDLWQKKPQPAPKPEEPPATVPWLRVGLLLRSIPFSKLAPLFISVPAIVFFALSGFVAWIMLFLKFAVGVFRL